MYVRLAFAVAAYLESEILIVDEVLAVGDAEFQKKCLGKMNEVSKGEGRTVLFVSHSMAAVKTLCRQALLLEYGEMKYFGKAEKAISLYINENIAGANKKLFDGSYNFPEFQLHEISLGAKNKNDQDELVESDTLCLVTDLTLKNKQDRYHVTYHIYNEMGEAMFSFSHCHELELKAGRNRLVCNFPGAFFRPGTFYLLFILVKNSAIATYYEKDIFSFSVADAKRELGVYLGKEPGYISPKFHWEVNYLND